MAKKVTEETREMEQKLMDDAAAAEIEVKKKTRKAARKTKETVEKAVQDVTEAAKETADNAAAAEIEVKKKTRKAGKKAKEKAEEAEVKIVDAAEAIADDAAAVEIEVKKTAGKVKRTAKKGVKKVEEIAEEVKKPARKAKAAKMNLVFETSMGRQITPEEVAAKVPKGADAAYIKLEENKIYWVKGDETGAVDIW